MRNPLPAARAAASLRHALPAPAAAGEPAPATAGPSLPETGFLRQHQVLVFVPVSRSTLWRRVRARTFPEPVRLSERVTAWRAEDVRRWIAEQGR